MHLQGVRDAPVHVRARFLFFFFVEGICTCLQAFAGYKRASSRRGRKKKVSLNYAANLIQTVCMCICTPHPHPSSIQCQKKKWKGECVLVIIKSRQATHWGVEKTSRALRKLFLPSQIFVAITTNCPSRYSGMISIQPDEKV